MPTTQYLNTRNITQIREVTQQKQDGVHNKSCKSYAIRLLVKTIYSAVLYSHIFGAIYGNMALCAVCVAIQI